MPTSFRPLRIFSRINTVRADLILKAHLSEILMTPWEGKLWIELLSLSPWRAFRRLKITQPASSSCLNTKRLIRRRVPPTFLGSRGTMDHQFIRDRYLGSRCWFRTICNLSQDLCLISKFPVQTALKRTNFKGWCVEISQVAAKYARWTKG